ncbi:MAG TPA: Uma2 family endonuclease [Ardenticatenaceae bacterium]|nr:Uma2 family endonuclease [Ardenticatenaceae bacterium]
MTATAATETKLITGEELLAMGDIGPCELIDGEIVRMSPTGGRHAVVELRFGRRLASFVEDRGIGWVATGEVGIYTRRNPDRVRGADIACWSKEQLPDGLPEGFLEVAPFLIVEIMSPSDRWLDVREKLQEYFAIGVEQLWIVERENRTVLIYHSPTEMRQLGGEDILVGDGLLEGFSLPLASMFAV